MSWATMDYNLRTVLPEWHIQAKFVSKKNECNDAKTIQTYRKFNVWDAHMPALLDINDQQTKSTQNKISCVQILDPS